MLALDPPGDPTIGACLAADLSGPRRHRYGAMRDLVIGVTLVLAGRDDRELGRQGGQERRRATTSASSSPARAAGSGLIARVALRLHPRPAAQATVVAETDDPRALWRELHRSQLEPSAVDFLPAGRLACLFEGPRRGRRGSGGRLPGSGGRRRRLGRESPAAS